MPGGAVCCDYLRMDALCEQTGIIIAFLGGRPGHIGPALTAIGPELGHRDTLSTARRRAKEVAASSFISHEQARARKASRREPRYPFIDTIHDRRTSSPALACLFRRLPAAQPNSYITEIRSEERRVGKGGVRTCRSRWSPYH